MKLKCRDLIVRLRNGRQIAALQNLDMTAGDVVAWMGPSGAGKTSLLRAMISMITGLPLTGFSIQGEVLTGTITIGYQPQSRGLAPWLTVGAFLKRLAAASNQRSTVDPKSLYECLQIGNLLNQFPDEVSGGEYQRCSLAASLLVGSDLLALDEPLTGVDFGLRISILTYIKRHLTSRGTPCLVITHDIDTVAFLANRLLAFPATSDGDIAEHALGEANWKTWKEFINSSNYEARRSQILRALDLT